MATIISAAVKLLLDSTGFQAGVAQSVAATKAAQQQMENSGGAHSVMDSLSNALSSVEGVASALEDVHPLFGMIATAARTAAIGIENAAVVQAVWTAATWATTAATTALMAVGLPLWGAIAVVVLVVVAAVAALTYGLYKLYEALTSIGDGADEFIELTKEEERAIEATDKWYQKLRDTQETLGMNDAQKSLYEYQKILAQRVSLTQEEANALESMAKKRAEEVAYAKERHDIQKRIVELIKQADQAGMTPGAKKVDDLKREGANAAERAHAQHLIELAEGKLHTMKQQAESAKLVEDIEKRASQLGMTDTEKRIASAQAVRATEEQIARIREAGAKLEAAEREKERIKQESHEKSQRAMRGAALRDSLMTPLEAYEKKMQDIENLRRNSAIDEETTRRAGAAALAEFQKKLTSDSGRDIAGPKFMNKGSYEDEIAKNRSQTPLDRINETNRKQLMEAEKAVQRLDTLNQEITKRNAALAMVNF